MPRLAAEVTLRLAALPVHADTIGGTATVIDSDTVENRLREPTAMSWTRTMGAI